MGIRIHPRTATGLPSIEPGLNFDFCREASAKGASAGMAVATSSTREIAPSRPTTISSITSAARRAAR
jgi:hypothetical protein